MKKEKEEIEIVAPDYSEEEVAYRSKLIQRMIIARNQREDSHAEFDDMTYSEYYDSNKRAANSYIPPKQNKQDTRINTGVTREKGVTLLSALLNYNLEPNIVSYDKNDIEVRKLGGMMEDFVRKSRLMEKYDNKRVLIYKELLDQGDCFVDEAWVEKYKTEKALEKLDISKIEKTKWTSKLKKCFEGCECKLIQGTKVYLGNIKEFNEEEQPYMFYEDVVHYDIAKQIFGKWGRWENVPRKVASFCQEAQDSDGDTYGNWSLNKTEDNYVSIIRYQDKPNNEFMIMLNGVMMLPIEFPLQAISPSGSYTLTKGSIEPISQFFAYSKSTPAKTKVDEEVLNEFMRLMILKTQQSFIPPYANTSKRLLSKNIFYPGVITNDIDPNLIKPMLPNGATGVTAPEFNAFQFVKEIIDSKSLNSVFQGEQASGNMTATQVIEMKKQQMMKLGLAVFGVVLFECKLAEKRLYNLIVNWTKPIDTRFNVFKQAIENIYRTISVESTIENGEKGTKIYEFNEDLANTVSSEQVMAENDFLSEQGSKVRKIYVNPTELAKMIHNTWYINVNPTEKNSSELDRMLFTQSVSEAASLFGIQSLNMEHLKTRFALLAKEDPEKFFIQGNEAMPGMMPEGAPMANTPMAGAIKQKTNGVLPKLREMV